MGNGETYKRRQAKEILETYIQKHAKFRIHQAKKHETCAWKQLSMLLATKAPFA